MTAIQVDVPVDTLVSYHYMTRRQAGRDLMAQIVEFGVFRLIADSGAFSAFTQGTPIDVDAYGEWLTRWRPHVFWAASLDVFGDPGKSFANWKHLRDRHGLDTVPTIHIGTDLSWLDAYAAEGVDFIGLGGMVKMPRPAQMRFLVACLRYARDRHPGMRFHAWGTTTNTMLQKLPLYSADSSGLLGQAFRFAALPLWDPRQRKIVNIEMDGHSPYRHRDLLAREYGINPATILRSNGANRSHLIGICVRSVQKRAQSYQDIHRVTPPTYGLTAPGEMGPRLHIAETELKDFRSLHAAVTADHRPEGVAVP